MSREPTIVLVHPTGTSARVLAPLAAALAGRYRVVCPDRPGWGEAPSLGDAPRAAYYERHGRWLVERIRELRGPCEVFGWSSGAFIALHAAVLAPDVIQAVHLYEPPLGSSRDHEDRARIVELARVLGWSAVRQHARAAEAFWRMVSGRADGSSGFARLDATTRTSLVRERGPLARELLAGTGEELRERLAGVRARLNLLAGVDTSPTTMRATTRLASLVPGAHVTTLGGLDHLGPLTHPAPVAGAIA